MAVSSSLHHVGVFRSVVRIRSSSKVDLFPNIRPTSLSPAISAYPAISGRGFQRTAALPVQAEHGCASSESEQLLVFYPHKFAQVLTYLRNLPDVRTRCRQIVRYGRQLPSCLPISFVAASTRVEGLPNTYVHAILDPRDPSLVYFYAHSDAAHVRGLAIILVAGLSGSPVQTIADMTLAPFMLLIGQSFLPARWCTQFMLLLEHMQRKAREVIGDKHVVVEDQVLSIMRLESLHDIRLKDEIDKTRVVHELLGSGDDDGNGVHVDCDDGDDVNLDVGKEKKYEYDENPIDNEDDGLSWRVKKYPPMHTVFHFDDDRKDSIASTTPPRWG